MRNTQTIVSFEVSNNGGAPSGDLRVTLPAVPWISLLSTSSVASLLPGQKTTVTLALNPPADLPLTRYDGNLVLAGANAGVSVPFQFRALSEAVGDLRVTVSDEYTYFVAEAPKVTNATVRVRDVITGNVVAQGRTGISGEILLATIHEGSYSLEVSADKHSSFRGPVTIVPGITNAAEPFISRQTVTYQWTVVPIEIQDTHRVVLQSVFETEVPIPNVVVEDPAIMPLVVAGRETRFEIKIRNEGLVAAKGVRLNIRRTRILSSPHSSKRSAFCCKKLDEHSCFDSPPQHPGGQVYGGRRRCPSRGLRSRSSFVSAQDSAECGLLLRVRAEQCPAEPPD